MGDPACVQQARVRLQQERGCLTIHHYGSAVKSWLTARRGKENIPKTGSVGVSWHADQQLFKAVLVCPPVWASSLAKKTPQKHKHFKGA